MEFDNIVEFISGIVSRRHAVEVRCSLFLCASTISEKDIVRQYSVRSLTHFHDTRLSDTNYVAVSAVTLQVSGIISIPAVILDFGDNDDRK